MTKCRAFQHEKLSTSKGVIRSRELALATGEEIASALGKQGVTNIRRISIRKGEEQIYTNTYIQTFNQPRSGRSAIVLRESSSTSQFLWGASNEKNMDTTEKPVEDDRHVPDTVKKIRTIWRKISWSKLDVSTADKIIRLKYDLAMLTKKRKGYTWGETQVQCVLSKKGKL